MSRRAVYQALINDSELNDMQIEEGTVFSNYGKDMAPVRNKPFVIIRWQERPMVGVLQGPQVLTIWAHWPREITTDYSLLDAILSRVKTVLTSMEHVDGEDGNIVTSVRFTGEGRDLEDPAYETITKNSGFEVQFRPGA